MLSRTSSCMTHSQGVKKDRTGARDKRRGATGGGMDDQESYGTTHRSEVLCRGWRRRNNTYKHKSSSYTKTFSFRNETNMRCLQWASSIFFSFEGDLYLVWNVSLNGITVFFGMVSHPTCPKDWAQRVGPPAPGPQYSSRIPSGRKSVDIWLDKT